MIKSVTTYTARSNRSLVSVHIDHRKRSLPRLYHVFLRCALLPALMTFVYPFPVSHSTGPHYYQLLGYLDVSYRVGACSDVLS